MVLVRCRVPPPHDFEQVPYLLHALVLHTEPHACVLQFWD